MTQPNLPNVKTYGMDRDVFNLMDLLIALAKRKRLLMLVPILVGVIAIGVSFLIPNTYKATTKLLPPQQAQSSAAALLSRLGGVAGMAAGVSGIKNPNEMYVSMIRSRTIADRLIARFKLTTLYETDSQEKVRKFLEENTQVSAGKDGIITIEFESKSQDLVAKITNAYVDELSQLTRSLALTEASQRRAFFEQQLERSKDNLAISEINLKKSLGQSGVISVDAESRTLLETAARIKAQISTKEIQINAMRAFVTPQHAEFRRAQEELASLKTQLAAVENGRPDSDTGNASRGGFENIKLLREVKYYQMLYELLAKQYEAARLDEAKDPSIIQVLDPAISPERKHKPKRLILAVLCSLIAAFVTVVWIVLTDIRERSKGTAAALQWMELSQHLRFGKQPSARSNEVA